MVENWDPSTQVPDRDRLNEQVEEYFAFSRRLASSSRDDRLAAQAGNPLDDLLTHWLTRRKQVPEGIWDVVVALFERAPDSNALAFVISGPLTDLVRHHGDQFAERLLARCTADPAFRRAMTTVYSLEGVPTGLQRQLGRIISRP
jgi:hypothetical protein